MERAVGRSEGDASPLDIGAVAGPVVRDLEAQEGVNRLERLGVPGADEHLRSAGRVLGAVGDVLAKALHRLGARRHAIVDEHRKMEVAAGEGLGDVPEVAADRVAARRVRGIQRLGLDAASIRGEREVVGGLLVGEAHPLIATAVDTRVVVSVIGTAVAGGEGCDEEEGKGGHHGLQGGARRWRALSGESGQERAGT